MNGPGVPYRPAPTPTGLPGPGITREVGDGLDLGLPVWAAWTILGLTAVVLVLGAMVADLRESSRALERIASYQLRQLGHLDLCVEALAGGGRDADGVSHCYRKWRGK